MAGYVWSPKAEIYCVRYRYYDPLLGRWLQRDPAGYVDGLNLYTYGLGNPWAYTDPYGLFTWKDVEDTAKDVGGAFVDGARELIDVVTGKAAREDAEHTHLVQQMEDSQKGKICENYYNGNVSPDDAAAMYDKVDGMAAGQQDALAALRAQEWDMIIQTGIDIATTVIPGGWIARGLGKALGGGRAARMAKGCLRCFAAGTIILMADLEPMPIEQLQLGDHVYSEPDQPTPTYGSLDYGYEGGTAGTSPMPMDYRILKPAFWRTITFEGRTADGGEVSVVLLRPQAWLEHNGIELGCALPIEVGGEHSDGIRVISIDPAPATIEPGSPTRGMVISTFRRTDREVFELFLDTDPTPLTITPEHPVWSVDRGAWVEAAELTSGDRIETLDGVAYVLAKLPAGERTVYNLEVHGDHTYYAGEQGVWVHNCHGNSKSYVGPSHVYAIVNDLTGQVWKVGKSMGRISKSGQSYRGSAQARWLARETGMPHSSRILDSFDNNIDALRYERILVTGFRRIGGSNTLPGNILPKP